MSRPICHAVYRLSALLAVMLLLAGCGTMKFEVGAPFDPNLVANRLHPGQSTMADVQTVLGSPYGTGSTMMPYHDSPRVTWTYFFDRGNVDMSSGALNQRLSYLFVFFKNDRFDSYIWFSTL